MDSKKHSAELISTNFYNKVIREEQSLAAYLRSWLRTRGLQAATSDGVFELVKRIQEFVFSGDQEHVDGILGPSTWRTMLSYDESTASSDNMIRLGSNKIAVPGVKIDHSIDLLSMNKKTAGKRDLGGAIHDGKVKILGVLHWDAALSAGRAARVLSNLGYSSNFGVDNPVPNKDGHGEATVYQWLNPGTHFGYHAGSPWNMWSACSFDLSNAATMTFQDHYKKMAIGERPVVCPVSGPFGGRKMLGMYPSQIVATLRILKAMAKATGLGFRFMEDDPRATSAFDRWLGNHRINDAESRVKSGFNGFVMHYQIDSNKWDIRCFIDQFVHLCLMKPEVRKEFDELYLSLDFKKSEEDEFLKRVRAHWKFSLGDLLK